jgi:hypothetical protein
MAEKWIDRGKEGDPFLLTPKTLALANLQAWEFRQRAEKAEAENKRLKVAILLISALFAEMTKGEKTSE